jgi:hypothetical protein
MARTTPPGEVSMSFCIGAHARARGATDCEGRSDARRDATRADDDAFDDDDDGGLQYCA